MNGQSTIVVVGTQGASFEEDLRALFLGAQWLECRFVPKDDPNLEEAVGDAAHILVHWQSGNEARSAIDEGVISRLRSRSSQLLLFAEDREALMDRAVDKLGINDAQYFKVTSTERWKIQLLQFLQSRRVDPTRKSRQFVEEAKFIVKSTGELVGLLGSIVATVVLIWTQFRDPPPEEVQGAERTGKEPASLVQPTNEEPEVPAKGT